MSKIVLRACDEKDQECSSESRVRFFYGDGVWDYIECYLDKRAGLVVRSNGLNGALNIRPHVSNEVHVKVEDNA